jgi:tRNA pseudouridine32 synthase/23S rRNA pseudouridine746 synthase
MKHWSGRRECHLDVNRSEDAPALLSRETGLSKGQVKRAMARGAVWLERDGGARRLRRAGRMLRPGDRLHLYYYARVQAMEPPPARLLVDEGSWSVWFKPPGMFSQGSRWGDHCSLVRWAEAHLEPRRNAFLVHRLDRAASGLMLVAHTRGAARQLSGLFRERAIRKVYRVVVRGRFSPKERRFDEALDGRPALTRGRLLEYDAEQDRSLLVVEISTGRNHQIPATWRVPGSRWWETGCTERVRRRTSGCRRYG